MTGYIASSGADLGDSAAGAATLGGARAGSDDLGGSAAGAATSGGARAGSDNLGGSAAGASTSGAGAGSEADSRTGADLLAGVGSGVGSQTGAGTDQCVAKTHRMVTAITGNTEDRGTGSVTASAEALGTPTARTANGGSARLDASLKHHWNALVSSNITSTMLGNTGVASTMAED